MLTNGMGTSWLGAYAGLEARAAVRIAERGDAQSRLRFPALRPGRVIFARAASKVRRRPWRRAGVSACLACGGAVLEPGIEASLLAPQHVGVDQAAGDRHAHRPGAGIERRRAIRGRSAGGADAELVIEVLDTALRTAGGQPSPLRDGLVGEAERDVDQALVLVVGDAFEPVLDAVLDAADLAVDDAMAFAENAAQRR